MCVRVFVVVILRLNRYVLTAGAPLGRRVVSVFHGFFFIFFFRLVYRSFCLSVDGSSVGCSLRRHRHRPRRHHLSLRLVPLLPFYAFLFVPLRHFLNFVIVITVIYRCFGSIITVGYY